MNELNFQELISVNGGSQESYENGVAAGEAVKEFFIKLALQILQTAAIF